MGKAAKWLYLAGACICLVSCGDAGQNEVKESPAQSELAAQITSQEETTEIVKAENAVWSGDMNLGSDGMSLDYASESRLVLHGYMGLFIYDMKDGCIMATLNLENINCADTQGDNTCEVNVSEDGNRVWLHSMASDDMYCYDINKEQLTKMLYNHSKIKEDSAQQEFIDVKEALKNFDDKEESSKTFSIAVRLSEEDEEPVYGWLSYDTWTMRDICFVIKNAKQETVIRLFDKEQV